MYFDVTVAGFGGQGVMVIGNILAYAAIEEGKNVTYWPSYGAEMRGGTANCIVVISDEEIGSPIVGNPSSLIIMNPPSLVKFAPKLKKDGILLFNSSLCDSGLVERNDIQVLGVPVIELATEAGNDRLGNMVALGAFLQRTHVVEMASAFSALKDVLAERHHHLIPINTEAIEAGYKFAAEAQKRS
jgi:2-oxoglutarate ferredoxin oxidoreductase subunit gamma